MAEARNDGGLLDGAHTETGFNPAVLLQSSCSTSQVVPAFLSADLMLILKVNQNFQQVQKS